MAQATTGLSCTWRGLKCLEAERMRFKPWWTGWLLGVAGTIFQSMLSNWLPSSWDKRRCYSGLLPLVYIGTTQSMGHGSYTSTKHVLTHSSEISQKLKGNLQNIFFFFFFSNLTWLKHKWHQSWASFYFLRFQFASD